MKRKGPATADDSEQRQQPRRRQPQTSCLNCRVKKLKCDLGAPCASCIVRGIDCSGRPSLKPAVTVQHIVADSETDATILSRLARLERAVFGDSQDGHTTDESGPSQTLQRLSSVISTPTTAVNTPSPSSYRDAERQQTAKLLDRSYSRDDHSGQTTFSARRLCFQVVAISAQLKRFGEKHHREGETSNVHALVMTRDEALMLLQDFFQNPYHVLHIISEQSARSTVHQFYTQLEEGHEGDPAAAALMLSIAALSASFFTPRAITHGIFASIEEAMEASLAWRETALTILDSPRVIMLGSLETCQARAILAYVVSNIEGCSARFRYLHTCSIAAARDMSLHLVDSTTTTATSDDPQTREIKRRLWWHLASTDWLLGFMGSPLDGTYIIHPRHFVVNRPRNLNDIDLERSDETFAHPMTVVTQVTCFLQRIRLGEISREVIDAREPGLPDVDITNFNKVVSLDLLYENLLAEMPPFMRRGTGAASNDNENVPAYLAPQRDLILLCLYFRRARLHRPFLLHDTDNPQYEPCRRACIMSARKVLDIATGMLEGSDSAGQRWIFRNPLAYRAGLIIGGIFMSCAVLTLTNAGLGWGRTTDGSDARYGQDDSAEIKHELRLACQVLAKAGEQSIFAANLLNKLVDVLKQHSVKDIDDLISATRKCFDPVTVINHTAASSSNDTTVAASSSPAWGGGAQTQLQQPTVDDSMMNNPSSENFAAWSDFFATMPEMESYDQLFVGLDYYCGPS